MSDISKIQSMVNYSLQSSLVLHLLVRHKITTLKNNRKKLYLCLHVHEFDQYVNVFMAYFELLSKYDLRYPVL